MAVTRNRRLLTGSFGPSGKVNYTLDDLENDDKFQGVAERFLESVGENSDDIFEYLRDSDFNLVSGMARATQSGKFTDQQKRDYAYLRSMFDKADMGSMKQYVELIKDGAVDMVTDPFTIAAALAAPFSGGTSLAARQALATTALQGSKAIATNKIKDIGKDQIRKATLGSAAIAGSWTGLDNHFRQNTEINTGLRKLYSNSETVGATALGAVTGAIFGNLAQKNALYNSKVGRLYSNDDYRRTAPAFFEIRKQIDTGLAKLGGSAASILNTMAEISPTARRLGQTFVDDFEKKLAGPRATRRIDYSFAEDLDNRRAGYIQGLDAALDSVRKTGNISPTDEIAVIRILRGAKPETKNNKIFLYGKEISPEVVGTAARLRKVFDSVYKHADEANMAPEYVEDWFARSWNREAIEADPEEFKRLLTKQRTKDGQKYKIVEPNQVDDVVTGMLNKQDELYASHSHLLGQARTFKDLPDNEFEKFLTNDLVEVSTNYLLNAARAIEIKKNFLSAGKPVKLTGKTAEGNLILFKQSLEDQFRARYVNKIKEEVRAAGGRFTGNDEKKIVDLFNSVTGNVSYYGDTVQALYDGMKLANSMAYLPLATLSSVTEAIIPFAKAKPSSAVKGAFDGLTKGHKIFTKEIGQILKDKYKMSDDQLIREMNSVWIGVDEAMGDVTNRLAGEGLQNEFTKRMAKGFFRFNLLIPWTKNVQLAAFSTGKDLIYDNLTKLRNLVDDGINVLDDDALIRKAIADAPDKGRLKGIMDSISKTGAKDNLSRINHLKSELFELGIDVEDGLRWIGQGAKQNDNFYRQVVRGAGRFTNSVILQTGRERAKVPTYMSNPKWDILTQFLRYPYVFSNTILKNFARDAIQNPGVNAPRVAAFGLMATNVALATNYWRSSEAYQKQIDREGVTYRDVVKALQRTGMAGPIDMGIRWGEASRYGKNPLVSAASLGGPLIGDVVNMAIYDRGLLETGARKLPLYGSKNLIKRYTGFDYDTIVQAAKRADEPIKEQRDRLVEALSLPSRKTYYKGGNVSKDVTDVTDNPANRIDPLTGLPYSAQTALFTSEFEERQPFNIGGLVARTVSKVAQQLTKSQKKNLVDGDYVYHFTSKANAEKIKKEGLNPLKTSNFVKAGTGERYQTSPAVYAFKNPADAVAFAKKHYWQSDDFEKLALIKIRKGNYKWEPDQAPDIESLFGPEGLEKLNIKFDKREVRDFATDKILDTYDEYLPSIKFSGGVIKSRDIVGVKSMKDIQKAFKDPAEFRGYSRHNENWPDVEGNPYGFAKIIDDMFENKSKIGSKASTKTEAAYMGLTRDDIFEATSFDEYYNNLGEQIPNAFIMRMPIKDYLKLTTKTDNKIDKIKKRVLEDDKFGKFNPAKVDDRAYPIHLKIDNRGKVLSHEGRHRAALIEAEGGKTVPVVIELQQKPLEEFLDIPMSKIKKPRDLGIFSFTNQYDNNFRFSLTNKDIALVRRLNFKEDIENAVNIANQPDRLKLAKGGLVGNTGYKELSDKEAEQFKIKLKANAFTPEEKDRVFGTLINTMDESLRPRQTDDAPRLEELKDAFMGAVERTFPIKQETVTETRPINLEPTIGTSKATGEKLITEGINDVVQNETVKKFLKEIAYVESKFGKDKNTFREKTKSVFQIDDIAFQELQRRLNPDTDVGKSTREYNEYLKINKGIDLTKVSFDDLNRPDIGAAASRAILLSFPGAIPETRKGRAQYWKDNWNKSGAGTPEKYLKDLENVQFFD